MGGATAHASRSSSGKPSGKSSADRSDHGGKRNTKPSGKRSARTGGRRSDAVHRIARKAARNPWGERAARVGLGARAVVFLGLGYLVARIALGALGTGTTSKPASGPGVAEAIVAQPGGQVVLGLLGVGLVLYALFSLLDAVLHHDDEDPAAKRWGDRLLSVWSFVLYGVFAGYCFVTAVSDRSSKQTSAKSEQQDAQWSADVLRWPGGWFWLGATGGVLLIIAAFLVSRALRRTFRSRLDRDAMSARMWTITIVLGVVGTVGRAALFGLVGWFILGAAIENDPSKGQGVDGAVRIFASSAVGPYLLWVLAVTLAIFALYLAAEARYRHV